MSSPNPSPLQISAMQLSDLSDVMVVELRNYDFPWTEGIFRDCIKSGYTLQAVRLEQRLIGYGVMQIAADEAHILNLCIDRHYNHRGYAKQLLEHLLLLAEQAKAKAAFLEVRPSNPRAMQMYDRAGFNEVGRRSGYYDAKNGREDAVVMAKSIGSEQ